MKTKKFRRNTFYRHDHEDSGLDESVWVPVRLSIQRKKRGRRGEEATGVVGGLGLSIWPMLPAGSESYSRRANQPSWIG